MRDTIKKDQVIILTKDRYSAYIVIAVCRALVDLNTDLLKSEYCAEHHEMNSWDFEENKFAVWLVRKNLIEEIPSQEWLLGAFGDIEEMETTKTPRIGE